MDKQDYSKNCAGSNCSGGDFCLKQTSNDCAKAGCLCFYCSKAKCPNVTPK